MDDIFPAEELLDAERRLGAALLAGDADAVGRLLHPHFVCIRPDGRSLSRDEELAGLRSGRFVVDRLVAEETVATVSERTGITRRILAMTGTYDEEPFDTRMLYSRTWVQGPEHWLLLMTHAGPAPALDESSGDTCETVLAAWR